MFSPSEPRTAGKPSIEAPAQPAQEPQIDRSISRSVQYLSSGQSELGSTQPLFSVGLIATRKFVCSALLLLAQTKDPQKALDRNQEGHYTTRLDQSAIADAVCPPGVSDYIQSYLLVLINSLCQMAAAEGDNFPSEAVAHCLAEYGYLADGAPPGFLFLPNAKNHLRWDCLMHLSRGLYSPLALPFCIQFPENYPLACPSIFFDKPTISHPLVDPESGEFQLPDSLVRSWTSETCSAALVLYAMKASFLYPTGQARASMSRKSIIGAIDAEKAAFVEEGKNLHRDCAGLHILCAGLANPIEDDSEKVAVTEILDNVHEAVKQCSVLSKLTQHLDQPFEPQGTVIARATDELVSWILTHYSKEV